MDHDTTLPVSETPESANVDSTLENQVNEMLAPFKEAEPQEEDGSEDTAKTKEEQPKEEKQEEKPTQPTQEEQPKPGRLDRRLAKVFVEHKLLNGEDAPDMEDVLAELKGLPNDQKITALKSYLAANKSLRTGTNEAPEMGEEDQEAIVEAKASERFEAMRAEIEERERTDDLIRTVEAHPELNETKPEYKADIARAVETLYSKGMKVSEAYQLVMDSVSALTKDKAQEKNRALSGTMTSSKPIEQPNELTWEYMAELQQNDPEKWMQMIERGQIPKE